MKILFVIVTLALLVGSTHAQAPTPTPNSTPAPSPSPVGVAKAGGALLAGHTHLTYTPPKNAQGGSRVDGDGGSRGGGAKQPSLYVLAPDHTGVTTRAQPSLFWYQSGPAGARFELTVVEPKKPKPLLKVGADKADQPGIHRLLLSRYNITLTPGVVYRWTIALVPDPANRSQDIIASGKIQRTEPDAQLTAALAEAEGLNKAALYAGKGFWYDALETVTNEIDAAPKDKALRVQRAFLLDQAGLKDAAASERK